MRLYVVGSSPAAPRPGGASSSYLLRTNETAVLLDLGCGAAGKLRLAMPYENLDAIVVSHMHADHFFDLVPLRYALKYGDARAQRLPLWLPPGGRGRLDALRYAVTIDAAADFFESVFDIREYGPTDVLAINDLRLSFMRTQHYVEAYAVRVEANGTHIAYSADTAPDDGVIEHARGAALFLCEAALGVGTEDGKRGHSSAYEAGEMAQRAGVERLLLTHYPAAVSVEQLVAAAQSRFTGYVGAAQDGDEFVAQGD